MSSVYACELPVSSLLQGCKDDGAYADCYFTEVPFAVSQARYVEAFYTTRLFRMERAILGLLAARPSTDMQARQLAEGTGNSFAAWRVEARRPEQLLVADFTGRTRSWLMVAPAGGSPGSTGTRLYFGSAVLPRVSARAGERGRGTRFRALLGLHRLYSRLLLGAAASRLAANSARGSR